jgi:membrane protein insertase Oxa1/YidC/SpoIIIJ
MSKERDVQVLQHKIAELETKIANFIKYGVDEKKRQNLELLKLKYEDELAELQLA